MNLLETVETLKEGDFGNTNSKSRVNQLKNWFFTFNNYTSVEMYEMETKFNEICDKYIFQEELGANGTPHLQGCIELHKPMRWSEFNLSKNIHWEKTNNKDKSIEYCGKDSTRNGKTFRKNVKLIKPLKVITDDMLYPWQKSILEISKGEPDGRSVHWYWESNGKAGKSCFCKYMFVKHKALVIQGGKLADIMNIIFNTNMDECEILLIDIPRVNKDKVSYGSIECILNGMITNTKYETGTKVFNPPHVFVLGNYPPDEFKIEDFSSDRWKITEINKKA